MMQEKLGGLEGVPDRPDEMMQEQHGGLEGVPDRPEEMMQEQLGGKRKGKELRDEERYGAYFALEVIKRRDGRFDHNVLYL
jgi:hypothetical protein